MSDVPPPPDRSEGLFDYPELERALDAHPFADVMDKYLGMPDAFSADHLNEMAVELEMSIGLARIAAELAKSPRYTSLYRYDIFSGGMQVDALGEHLTPPRHAWFRVFEDLTFDKIKVARTDEETVVLIDHPSVYVSSNGLLIESAEPTLLFSSHALRESPMVVGTSEDNAMGLVFNYGATTPDIIPDPDLANPTIVDIYNSYTK